MKIEDAIKRYESWAEDDRIDVLIRKDHRQIADWLKELNADRPQKVVAQVTFDEEKLREIVKDAVINEEYEITDRPQGEWIIEIDANGYTYGRCSICGMRQYAGHLNFCPNCGADMRKGADDE